MLDMKGNSSFESGESSNPLVILILNSYNNSNINENDNSNAQESFEKKPISAAADGISPAQPHAPT